MGTAWELCTFTRTLGFVSSGMWVNERPSCVRCPVEAYPCWAVQIVGLWIEMPADHRDPAPSRLSSSFQRLSHQSTNTTGFLHVHLGIPDRPIVCLFVCLSCSPVVTRNSKWENKWICQKKRLFLIANKTYLLPHSFPSQIAQPQALNLFSCYLKPCRLFPLPGSQAVSRRLSIVLICSKIRQTGNSCCI